jgi:hypothetical protein
VDLTNNYLISTDAQYFFENDFNYSGDPILKTALRYLAIRRCDGKFENLKPIRVHRNSFATSYSVAKYIETYSKQSENIYLLQGSALFENADLPEGWMELPEDKHPVCKYLSETSPTAIYINEQLKQAFVFVTKQTEAWTKKFASILFRVLPWLFPKNKPEGDEVEFFKAIADGNGEKVVELIEKVQVLLDFRKDRLRKQLSGWSLGLHEAQIQEATRKVDHTRQSIHSHRQNLSTLSTDLAMQINILTALRNTPPPTDDLLYEFFDSHKQLTVLSTNRDNYGNQLQYQITETIQFYDQDEFLSYINDTNSYFYNNDYSDELYALMKGLFGDEKGHVRARCVFKLSNFTSLVPIRNFNFNDNFRIMPHPHLDTQTCLGGNEQPILEYMAKGEWDLAIQQTIAAAKNINFGDETVVVSMMRWLENSRSSQHKLVIADNGNEMTIQEFLAYIKEDTK